MTVISEHMKTMIRRTYTANCQDSEELMKLRDSVQWWREALVTTKTLLKRCPRMQKLCSIRVEKATIQTIPATSISPRNTSSSHNKIIYKSYLNQSPCSPWTRQNTKDPNSRWAEIMNLGAYISQLVMNKLMLLNKTWWGQKHSDIGETQAMRDMGSIKFKIRIALMMTIMLSHWCKMESNS